MLKKKRKEEGTGKKVSAVSAGGLKKYFQAHWQLYLMMLPPLIVLLIFAYGGVNVDGKNFWANKPGKWQDWTILEPVEGPDGVRLAAKSLTDYFGSCLGVVSASCKNPEIAVALFDFLASEEGTLVQSFGPQGLAWDYVDEGTALDGGTAKYANYKIDEDYDWVGNGYKKAYGDSICLRKRLHF